MKVAIVGSGVSGLVCAHLLSRRHEITLFEAADRPGGHVHTVPVRLGEARYEVDTGFIVFNERTYPRFVRLLGDLGVESQPTDMSFSVRCERTGLEYAGGSLGGLFAQPSNLLRPSFHRMLRDVLRFWRDARAFLERPDEKVTLGAWLSGRGYSRELSELHVLPMGAAIWSVPEGQMLRFPALPLLRFFENHGLLQHGDRPVWRTICGGSHRYVRAILAPLRDRLRLRTPVRAVERTRRGARVHTHAGSEDFDRVVIAAHSDQALRMLAAPTAAEREVLGAIRYQPNEAVLHTDASLLPRARRAWAAWNHHLLEGPEGRVAVTYHMNRLQRLDAPAELCVTLNRSDDIDPARVLRRMRYAHPVFDGPAMEAQRHYGAVSGSGPIHYCGAYWGYGFHEDGVASALRVAEALGESP